MSNKKELSETAKLVYVHNNINKQISELAKMRENKEMYKVNSTAQQSSVIRELPNIEERRD